MHNNESRILSGYHISSLDDRHKDATRYRSTSHIHPLVNQNSTTQKVEDRSHRNNIPRQYERKLVSNNVSHREKLLEADKVKVPSKNIQLLSTSASKSVKDYSRVHSHSKPKPDIVSQSDYLKHLERTKPELANINLSLTNGNSSSHSLEKEMVHQIKSVEPFSCLQDPNAVVPQKITYPRKINLMQYKERKNKANNAGIQRSQEANIKSSSQEVKQSVSNHSKEISKNSSSVSRILDESLDPLLWGEAKSIIPSTSNSSVNKILEPMDSISSSNKEFNNTEKARPEESFQKGVNRYNIEKEAFYSTSKIAKNDAYVEKNFLDHPVILTISSDEEDNKDDSEDYTDDCGKEKSVVSELCHHPVSEAQKNSMLVGGGSHEEEHLLSSTKTYEDFVSLRCKVVRLGSYKAYPKARLKLEKGSLTMVVPSLIKDKDPVTLILKQRGIGGIRVQLEGDEPMMFIYIMSSTAAYIREKLHMKKGGPYLDPKSEDEAEKRIGIFPDPVKPDFKRSILEFWSNVSQKSSQSTAFIKEISVQKANEVLISMTKSNEEQDSNQICTRQETKTLFVYPPPPEKGGITITTDDYYCLEEEQFLNDVIIDFYIKWFMLSQLAEKDRERTHVFSTFFYKRLTSKPKTVQHFSPEGEQKLTAAQTRHARVQSWTKNVDIFEKDFIIVPINERSHWFLAVICFPGLDGPVRIKDGKPVSIERIENSRVKAKTKTKSSLIEDSTEWSDRDEAEADEEELEVDKIEPPPTKKLKLEKDNDQGSTTTASLKTDEEDPIKQPCILIFDSMSGSRKNRIVATLREYLAQEYIVKTENFKEFSTNTIMGACPKVPQQTNFTDCGLFTLQFVQSFFQHPLKDFRFPIKTLANWFNQDIVGCKRRYIADIIKQLLNDQKPHHGISLPSLHFTSYDKTQPTNKSSIEKIDSKSSVEKLGNYSSIETILKKENLCLNREHKMEDDEPCRKSWPTSLNSTPLSSCSSTIDYQPQAGSEVMQKEAKKIRVKLCDKSLSSARPRTPLPYNETSNLPLAISEDEDSGNHSDEIAKDILNKGFLETFSGSQENLCSKYENSKASFENENFSGNSNSSSICIRKESFSGSSNSTSKKNSKEESSKRTSKKSSLSMSSNSVFKKISNSHKVVPTNNSSLQSNALHSKLSSNPNNVREMLAFKSIHDRR